MIDPITIEVIRETLVSTVREMRVTLVRTAYSSILYEGEDFSCVLMDGMRPGGGNEGCGRTDGVAPCAERG